ncbi:MAG: PadR family transcriptional regulator [Gemmatimonadetes bacterium]|nr:PadR family transcriptional regulator [Gemmatimonadota bacterium]
MFSNADWGMGAWANCLGPNGLKFARGAGRRFVRKGDLKFLLLKVLADGPMHGYEIIRRIEEDSGGLYSPSPGSVYPTLQMLDDQRFVNSVEEDGRRVYTITEEGRAFLAEHNPRAKEVFSRFGKFGDRVAGPEARAVTRSFIRLAQVSFDHTFRREAGAEALEGVRRALDRATREVEAALDKAGAA